jgi:hypothetical protein
VDFLAERMRPTKRKFYGTALSGRFREYNRGMKPNPRDGGVLVGMPLPVRDVYE